MREFRALWIAETGSSFGDQLARVALALLVFSRTSSALLTALTYALTFLPAVIGGLLLSGLADRYPRRRVIIVTDSIRAVLAASMAITAMPLEVLWVLVGLLSLASGPFKAAQLAVLPQILHGDRYTAGLALRQITSQFAQVTGFLAGGFLVAALSAPGALLLNAGTFLASAILVAVGVRARPAARHSHKSAAEPPVARPGRGLLPVFVLVSLTGLWIVPEGLAAPYADALGSGSFAVGVLMAADPAGSVIGAWLATRLRSAPTLRSVVVPAFAAGIPLIACALRPGLYLSIPLWAISGAFSTIFLIRTQALLVDLVPDNRRGTVLGRISTCLYSSQGFAIAGGGVVSDELGPFAAVATAGSSATAVVVLTMLVWGRARPRNSTEDEPQPDGNEDQISLLRIATSGGGWATVRGWALWDKPLSAALYLTVADFAAIGLTLAALLAQSPAEREFMVAAALAALGLTAAEMSIRVERMRRWFSDTPRTPHVNLTSVWTLAAALSLPAGLAVAVVLVLYGHLWFRIWRRLSHVHTYQVLFNVANVVLCCHVTSWSFHDFVASAGMAGELLWLLSAIALYFVVNSTLAAGAIALLQPDRSAKRLLGNLSDNVLELATLCMGTLTALLLSWKPWLVPLVFLPMYALHRSVLIKGYEIAATTDGKTGLLNAVSWQVLANKELGRSRRQHTRLGVLMIDLDHFREVNKRHGHLVGDRALKAVADALRQHTRGYDLCGRFGGEEFVVLLPETDGDVVLDVAERLCEQIRELRVETGTDVQRLSVSIGAATFPRDGDRLDDLLLAADMALFAAKDAGRDQVRPVQVN
ncbi:MAG: MFS transporter [Kibdelosporangium sp.]